jgi:hypothetical protein
MSVLQNSLLRRGSQTKSPETLGALNILLQYSNDITNPVKRLYATTNIDSVVSS